ncbi:MAG: hypothetical protein ACRD3S_06690 [Terracidiphilus sp.]
MTSRKPQLIRPGVASNVGQVNSSDNLDLVIESVSPDTKHIWPSTIPVFPDGAGGSPIG